MAGYMPSALRQCQRQYTFTGAYRRVFSSSSKRQANGVFVNFPPSSSPELDAIFASARSAVFFPSHLRIADRRLIYRESQHHLLTGEEPVFVSLSTVDALYPSNVMTEKFKLEPKVYFDKMSSQKMLLDVLRLAETKEDWMMVAAFLREYKAAKRKLKQSDVSKLIRTAASKGYYGTLVNMFRRSKELGLYIDSKETAIEVMLLCLRRAYASGWDEQEVSKAWKNADFAILMMTQPDHAPQGLNSSQANEPEVLGCALALVSAASAKFHNFQDEDGKVLEYAQRFLKSWSSKVQISLDKSNMHDMNLFLANWSPAWLGVQLAQRIVQDVKVSRELGKVYNDVLGPAVGQARKAMQDFSEANGGVRRRGLEMSETLAAVLEK